MRKTLLTKALILFAFLVSAQNPSLDKESLLDQALRQQLEKMQDAGDETVDLHQLSMVLSEFIKHPLNLNLATKEQLQELALLDEDKISALLSHIAKHGKLLCLEEIQSIAGFDLSTIQAIRPFVCVYNTSPIKGALPAKLSPYLRHSFLMRYSRTLQHQDGFIAASDGEPPTYLGSPDKLLARYRFSIRNNFSVGLLAEKDAGESLGRPDFLSAYVFLKSEGWLRRIAIGDYRLSYGQGLLCWSGFSGGKSAEMMSIRKNAEGIRPYTSTDENAYQRGAALAFGKGPFQLDVFGSKHSVDANVLARDSITGRALIVSALQTSGYHRTESECADLHALTVTRFGGHAGLSTRPLQLGLTWVKTDMSAMLLPGLQPYQRFAPQGQSWINGSFDYSLFLRNFTFFGECGKMQDGGMAVVNGFLIALHPNFSLSMLQRDYVRNYVSFTARGAGESADTRNEQGLLMGWTWKLNEAWTLNGYCDRYRFPWLKYGVPASSGGVDGLVQLGYVPSKKTSMDLRWRQESKEEQAQLQDVEVPGLQSSVLKHLRFQVSQQLSPSFQVRSRADYTTRLKRGESMHGVLMTQDLLFKPLSGPCSFNLRYALFEVDDYDARIYVYENDVLYSYSMTAFYGRGLRWYANLRIRLRRGVDVWINYSSTLYTDRREISSGPDRIDGSRRSEIAVQGRWEF